MSHFDACHRTSTITRSLLILVAVGIFVHASAAQNHSAEPERGAIQKILDSQTAAWNRGDLEGYMNGYWKSPELIFQSNGTVEHGWQATLERYRRRYQKG